MLAVLLLCAAWVAQAGNLTVKVGSETLTGKASLEEALRGKTLSNITSIKISAGEFTAADWNYLLSKRSELSVLAEFTITSGITSVADSPARTGNVDVAYFGDAIKEVVIHKIEKIGNRTFYMLPNLTKVSLPDATSIGAGAFRECTSLCSVSLPKVTTIDVGDVGSSFLGCTALTSISLPVVEHFAGGTFDGCKNLALIQLGATPPTATAANIFLNLPTTRYLVLVNANGTPLVGDELATARAQYNLTDNKWNGWTIIEPSITVKVNDTIAQTATSLEEAISASGVQLASITSLEVSAGAFMTADWEYLKSKKSNLSALTSLVITKGVSLVADLPDAVGNSGEYIPSNIQRVVIHKLKRVGKCGFDSYSKLVEAELPDAKFLGKWAFYGCKALKKVYLPVVSTIGISAFYECSKLTSVNLPKLTSIAEKAFVGCSSLTQLQLGTAVPSVGENAFSNTAATRYLVLVNASGTPLTGTALTNAKNAYMADAGWNGTTQKWHGWSFDWKLRLSVNGNDIVGASLEHALASSGVALGDITEIYISAGEFVAADWEYLRNNRATISNLEKFTIMDIKSVADIPNTGNKGYFGDSIKDVLIYKVKVIGENAFDQSPNLTKVSLPNATTLSKWAFFKCPKLESVSIPAVTTIGVSAFYECKSLSRLILLKATDIGNSAFSGCDSLTELWLGSTPPTVGNQVFDGCPAKRYLRPMENSSTPADATAIANYKAAEDGNTADGKWYGWALDWVSLSVNGADAVRDTSLQAAIEASGVELGEITNLSIEQGNIVKADWTYLYRKKSSLNQLSEFTINSEVGDVNNDMYHRQLISTTPRVRYAYYSVFGSSLRSFSAKRGLNQIPQSAFSGCSNLTMVDVPNLNGIVGTSAFSNCTKLVSIDLKKATQVNAGAFDGATMLSSVKCPAVTTILASAFKNCESLTHIALGAIPPTVNNANAFDGTATTRYLELVDANGKPLTGTGLDNAQTQYKNVDDGNTTDSYWYGWAIERHIQIKINGGNEQNGSSLEAAIGSFTLSSITSLEVVGGAFMTADWEYLKSKQSNLSALTSLVITDGVSMVADLPDAGGSTGVYIPRSIQRVVIHKLKRVGKCGFDACSELVEAELPDAVELGKYAFWGCSGLKKVYLPVVSSIGPYSFTRCSTLTSVNLPKLTSIAETAFSGCPTIVQLQLGTAVPSVGDDAFKECPSPRYLVLVDADGTPLTGDARTTAQETYKADAGWDATEEKWHGWGFGSISLKVNGGAEITAATFAEAVEATGVELGEVANVEVTAGAFLTHDWNYLLAQKDQLSALESFVVTDKAAHVANSPDVEENKNGYFGAALKEVSIAKMQVLGVNSFDEAPENLTTANLPDVTEVRDFAFRSCKALTCVSLPKVKSIGKEAFSNCSALKQIQLGTTVPTVGSGVFSSCPDTRYLVLMDADTLLTGDELITAQDDYKADDGWSEEKWRGWSFATPRIISIVSKNGQVLLEQGVPAGENQYAVVAELTPTISFKLKANSGYSGGSATVFETGNEANKITTTNTNGTYSFDMPAHDVTIRATYQVLYTIKVQANPVAGGTVTGGGNYSSGSSVVVRATPSSGYRFVRWTENGVEKSTEAVYTFNASSSCTLVAEFEKENSDEGGETGLFDTRSEAITLYPNPTTGAVQVEATGMVLVSNTAGQLLQRVPSQGKVLIDLSGYPSGVYIIRVGNAVGKVIKQ